MERAPPVTDPVQPVTDALEDLLEPIARLCVVRGIQFEQAEELFKRAFVQAARAAQAAPGRRDISRISIATGINRREVTRLSDPKMPRSPQRMSPATQVYTHWVSYAEYRSRGRPRRLPRHGPAPSFESLAHAVTRDVHPRSLLEELCRLGLARLSDDGEWVEALAGGVVPSEDNARMLGFLAANAGDHLRAAVANVLDGERQHFEQALFSNTVSQASAATVRELARTQWSAVMTALVPVLESMIEADRKAGRSLDHRVRVGLFSYHEPLPDDSHDESK